MRLDDAALELAINPEPRCPCVLVLDVSGSMGEGNAIGELNEGLRVFREALSSDAQAQNRVQLAVLTFGGERDVTLVQDFVDARGFQAPSLRAGGVTPMGAAIIEALRLVEDRKALYRENGVSYYRPWIFFITDGEPTAGDPWQEAARQVHEAEEQRRVSFFAIGVKDANLDVLAQIAPPERPPLTLEGLKFQELFVWLSQSMAAVTADTLQPGIQTALPPTTGWGRVRR